MTAHESDEACRAYLAGTHWITGTQSEGFRAGYIAGERRALERAANLVRDNPLDSPDYTADRIESLASRPQEDGGA